MLIEFTVSNFRSIKEPQTLSMLATSLKEHPDNVFDTPDPKIKLLKTAVIYGANASGKSNLIDAFEVFQNLIIKQNILPESTILAFEPFLLDKTFSEEPITFEIEFFGFGDFKYRYNYKISFNKTEILYESLFYYPKGQNAKLFEREKNKIDFGDSLKGLKESIAKLLLPNQVFLNKAANNNNEHLKIIFLSVVSLLKVPYRDFNYLLDDITLLVINEKSELHKKLSKLIVSSDTGLIGFNIKTKGVNKNFGSNTAESYYSYLNSNSPFEIKWRSKFFEGLEEKGETELPFDQGSLGTKKLFGLGGYLLNAMDTVGGAGIIIDELNASFHPLMTEAIIKLFHNKETNPNNAQLIFTTHDTSILRNELFRRDQIWFTDKDYYGATALFSMYDFDFKSVRKGIPFDRWYLSGRFGALPAIRDFNYFQFNNEAEETK